MAPVKRQKSFLFRHTSASGFSLVELMVVIAIIGALATIAIPKYNVFTAKSRMAEAQTNLAGIYSFEKNFLTQYSGYTSSLGSLGYRAEGKLRYDMGWSDGGTCPPNFTQINPAAVCDAATMDTNVQCTATGSCRVLLGADNVAPTLTGNNSITGDFSGFAAEASSRLVASASEDTWTIDQSKNLLHLVDGSQDGGLRDNSSGPILIGPIRPHGPIEIENEVSTDSF